MYLKRIVFLVTCLCLAFAFSISAYAKPEEGSTDSFFDTFAIDQDDLKTNASEGNVGLYEVSENGIGILKIEDINDDITLFEDSSDTPQIESNSDDITDITQTEDVSDGSFDTQTEDGDGNVETEGADLETEGADLETEGADLETEGANLETEAPDVNDYKVFKLYKGFSKLSVVTFAKSKMLSGNGEENTTIGIMVFTVSEEGNINTLSESMDTIGASGLYNTSIDLQIGDNNVIIAVKKDDLLIYRLFKVTVKEEETKGLLENIQLNFLPGQSDDNTDGDSSDVDNPLPISNLPGFDAVEN